MIQTHDGRMLATIRGFRGITQKDLAKVSQVPHPYISRFENGIMNLDADQLTRLEKALGVTFAVIRPAFELFAAVAAPDCADPLV